MPTEPFDAKAHWEHLYQNRSPLEVSWYQVEPTLSLELIHNAGIGPEDALIDVGGGASVLVDHLLERGYGRVAVLDLSGNALAHARRRLGPEADRVEWFEADVTAFQAPHRFALWHDRAVFHFLTQRDQRDRYRKTLMETLEPGGQVIIAAFALGGPTRCSGLEIVQYDARTLGETLGAGFRLLESREECHRTPSGKTQQFGYHRFLFQGSDTELFSSQSLS